MLFESFNMCSRCHQNTRKFVFQFYVALMLSLVHPLLSNKNSTVDVALTPSGYFQMKPELNLTQSIFLENLPKDGSLSIQFLDARLGDADSCNATSSEISHNKLRIFGGLTDKTLFECPDSKGSELHQFNTTFSRSLNLTFDFNKAVLFRFLGKLN